MSPTLPRGKQGRSQPSIVLWYCLVQGGLAQVLCLAALAETVSRLAGTVVVGLHCRRCSLGCQAQEARWFVCALTALCRSAACARVTVESWQGASPQGAATLAVRWPGRAGRVQAPKGAGWGQSPYCKCHLLALCWGF
jgi:hypothetical protein